MTRKHVHEEVFPVDVGELFRILHTPSAIRGWWGAARAIVEPTKGGRWVAAWGDDEDAPDYITSARLSEFDPPRRLVFSDYEYFARRAPPPFEAHFVTEFRVTPHPGGASLRVTQDGFPGEAEADEFYAACGVGWRNTFDGIRRYLATLPSRG